MTSDEQIGRNLALARGETSQKDLADAMRSLGFKWSQATVWSIEKGERPLRLAEAQAVAGILHSHMEMLLSEDGVGVVHTWTKRVYEAYQDILKAMGEYDEARVQLAIALDGIPDVEKGGRLRVSTDWVSETVERAVRDYQMTQLEEAAAFRARWNESGVPFEDIKFANGRWLDLLNEVNSDFYSKVKNGEPEEAS